MAEFLHLPDEILLEIASHLTSIEDFAALSVQCRRLNYLADMPNRSRLHWIQLNDSSRHDEYVQLLLEIIKQPKLALYVHQLEIDTDSLSRTRVRAYEKTDSEDEKLVAAAIRAAGFPDDCKDSNILLSFIMRGGKLVEPPLWSDPSQTWVSWGFHVAVGVLLLSLCPNIYFLQVDPAYGPLEGLVAQAASKNSPSGHLANLRDFRVIMPPFDQRHYVKFKLLAFLEEVHRLPSIDTVMLRGVYPDESDKGRLHARKSNISNITISSSCLSSSILTEVIRHSKSLEVFKFTAAFSYGIDGLSWGVLSRPLGMALEQHKSSLQVLELDCDLYIFFPSPADADLLNDIDDSYSGSESNDDDDDHNNVKGGEREEEPSSSQISIEKYKEYATIGSLHEFTALTHLGISVSLLLGPDEEWYLNNSFEEEDIPEFRLIDRLPPKLESLRIIGFRRDRDRTHTKMVDRMMEMRAEHLPSLKDVEGVYEHFPPCSIRSSPYDIIVEIDSSASQMSTDSDDDSEGDSENDG